MNNNWSCSPGLVVKMERGPFQDNGATPWYCVMGIGTPPQPLYICFDTGSNFNWVTSSLCGPDRCVHYAGHKFNIECSASFDWIDQSKQLVSFGPWGDMYAELGSDFLSLSGAESLNLRANILMASEYNAIQFQELDWDGGIGLASSQQSAPFSALPGKLPFRSYDASTVSADVTESFDDEFHFFLKLMKNGMVSKDMPFISFINDSEQGYVGFGVLDENYQDSLDYVFLPWECYQEAACYLWSTGNASVSVGGDVVGSGLFFALDSGSSQFKGDSGTLGVLQKMTESDNPEITINLKDTNGNDYAELKVTSDIYKCEIEAGQYKGEVKTQFEPLANADKMLLVGSVIMDHLYTVYEYSVRDENHLDPVGMWIFNKPDGPVIITNRQARPASIFNRGGGNS
ncbi:pepsin-like aspartic protease [Vibrio salinus]|uniref:pepsin-like aspartic protease n=1 Tax=Vibrio salinus TaxID=2899784 RepID=UPI001E37B8D0|nr:pepsin-like aspartic protease [Vibrio salinus]MCE0494425.1 A1 family peptidase [Vibrio salinus]